MNWAQFKDPVSRMCLAGGMVTSWSRIQEVACQSYAWTLFTILFSSWIPLQCLIQESSFTKWKSYLAIITSNSCVQEK